MSEDDIIRSIADLAADALQQRLDRPHRPPAADMARSMGYDVDAFERIEWRPDGDGLILTPKSTARTITFTVGPGLLDEDEIKGGETR